MHRGRSGTLPPFGAIAKRERFAPLVRGLKRPSRYQDLEKEDSAPEEIRTPNPQIRNPGSAEVESPAAALL